MDYNEGVQHMLNLKNQKGSFSPIAGITVNYPGRKKPGDYRLEFNNRVAPTHADICLNLYNLITYNNYTFNIMNNFLSDIYNNGTNTTYCDATLEELKHIIYWITLQEEINYPRSKGYAGINLAFCRFFEAIYSTLPTSNITINQVQVRCNNHGINRPVLYNINIAPDFYHY